VIGAVGTFAVDTLGLLGKRAAVKGWYSGVAADSEDTLVFSQLNDVNSMNEIFPFEEAQAAYDRMMSGKARCQSALNIDPLSASKIDPPAWWLVPVVHRGDPRAAECPCKG
jgi:alcohol dehydrogenase